MKRKQQVEQATIKDVARLAGVSIATVSRIVNQHDSVSEKLERRVNDAIGKLKYRPNALAQALKRNESHSMGLIIPDIENPYFPALVRGVEDAANQQDFAVILCNTDGQLKKERQYIDFLLEKRVDGILFTGNNDCAEIHAVLQEIDVPLILLDRLLDVSVDAVVNDNRIGAFWAVEHLIRGGCRKIACIGGPTGLSTSRDRFQGYCEALSANHIVFEDGLYFEGNFTFDGGWAAASSFLSRKMDFDGIFAANDMMAIGAIELLVSRGIHAPGDIAVAGFDDIPLAAWYKPALTTVRQPVYSMGQYAVQMLLERKSMPDLPRREMRLRPELVVRNSTR